MVSITKLKTKLYKADNKAIASLETFNGRVDLTDAACGAKSTCLAAAKALREAALRFEMLAKEPEPFKSMVQAGVNRRKV